MIENAKEELIGRHVDKSKCFDGISPAQGIELLKALGMLEGLASLLTDLYDGRTVWTTVDSTFAREQITPTSGVMQGYHFFVLILIVETACAAKFI